jgi:hypothetical protein
MVLAHIVISVDSSLIDQPYIDLNHCLSGLSTEIAATGTRSALRAIRVILSNRSSIGV